VRRRRGGDGGAVVGAERVYGLKDERPRGRTRGKLLLHMYINIFISPSLSIYIHLSVSIYLSIHPSIYPYVSLSLFLSLSLYLSIYVSTYQYLSIRILTENLEECVDDAAAMAALLSVQSVFTVSRTKDLEAARAVRNS